MKFFTFAILFFAVIFAVNGPIKANPLMPAPDSMNTIGKVVNSILFEQY